MTYRRFVKNTADSNYFMMKSNLSFLENILTAFIIFKNSIHKWSYEDGKT